jgi:transcriptional regulator with XRE-family HTH domain
MTLFSAAPLLMMSGAGNEEMDMDDQEVQRTLGDAIRARRQELGWSQEDLAKRIADHGDEAFRQSDVSRLERGKVTLPRRERLEHVAAVLGLSLGDLLARSGWTGAASAFATDRSPTRGGQEIQPDRVPTAAGSSVSRSRAVESAATSRNLRQLIQQAHETRTRTQEVLRQCEVTRALYEQPRRRGTGSLDPNGQRDAEVR